MSECTAIDGLATPYVDGQLSGVELEAIEHHLRACPPCAARMTAERAVRDLLRERHEDLRRVCAPPSLRANCAALGRSCRVRESSGQVDPPRAARPWRWGGRRAPVAVAAALVLLVGGAALFQATQGSSRVLAAELTADHVKCFGVNAVFGMHQTPGAVEASMASEFGWDMRLPPGAGDQGLELVGARQCLYVGGAIAHVMYKRRGQPVSLFMLPRTVRAEQLVTVLGHQCAMWSNGDRTFVLVSKDTGADMNDLSAFARATFR